MREITRFNSAVDQLVIRLYGQDDLGSVLASRGIEVVALGLDSGAASRNWPLGVRSVRSWIRRYNPAVVHSSLFTANLVGQLAARSKRVPVLSTLTQSGDVGLVRAYQPGASKASAAVLRGIAARPARSRSVHFRALTIDASLTNIRALGISPDRVRVIPRGVETNLPLPDPTIRARLGLPPDAQILVNIGRQAGQKGHGFLIDTFERVAAYLPRTHLVVLGREGDATRRIRERLAVSPVADRVHFLGFRPDVGEILRGADVFVFSSLMEGLGTAVLEAMAADIPVVAFDIPPIREVTDGGRVAYLVPVGDTRQLAEAACGVLAGTLPGRAVLAREWTRENYDIGRVAGAVQGYLESVAASA